MDVLTILRRLYLVFGQKFRLRQSAMPEMKAKKNVAVSATVPAHNYSSSLNGKKGLTSSLHMVGSLHRGMLWVRNYSLTITPATAGRHSHQLFTLQIPGAVAVEDHHTVVSWSNQIQNQRKSFNILMLALPLGFQ
jgi:hypothetical protein